ncbi:MAG TPA: M23 family metallopeptidase [Solirubrobacterales bacterium]|nr:M23 family metallopeptidase [Solirubrobacterales bacterium]
MISSLLHTRSRVRLELGLAVAIVAGLGVTDVAQAQVGGGAAAPGDPQVTGIQCLTRCINGTTGTVKSKMRLSGTDLGNVQVVSLPRGDGKRAKDPNPTIKPTGAVIARVGKGSVSGPVRVRDSFGQVKDSSVPFAVGTNAQLRAIQQQFRFPIRGPHDYGSSGSRFGSARSGHSHQGQDVFASCGTKLVAIHTGRVKAAGYQGSAGNYVVIDADGVKQDHVYMHLQSAPRVSAGQRVTTGQQLGKVGETCNAQGCHLHFEIWAGKGWYSGGSPIDPLGYLRYWDSYS